MPRLANADYIHIHYRLQAYWNESQIVYGYLSPTEQWDLHKFFWPTHDEPDQDLLEHRKEVSSSDPSLPQRAGQALRHFKQAAYEDAGRKANPVGHPKKRTNVAIRVYPVVLPEPDYRKAARALLSLAKAEQIRGVDNS